MAKNIEYRDNTEEVLSALEAAIKRGNEAIGMTAEGHAKKKITSAGAVDTGRLRNSITYALAGEEPHVKSYKANKGGKERETYTYDGTAEGKKGSGVYIGTNVEYAVFVENGAQGRTPVHFLQDAATGHTDQYKKLMEDSMKNA
ncbi:MAG: HK97 gp10 family phage protein [Clostridia bacterium]|nr:HK97 gp10 family phage protein [Clostridia bacterium]